MMEESAPGQIERAESPSLTSEKGRDLEFKRIRGEISCAECRRQKLKCDKKIPCSSCVRRGCQSVCPTSLLPSKHKASSKTERFHKKLLSMSMRIQQLEDALQVLQACVSSTPHPLLAKELLKVKNADLLDDTEEPVSAEADLHIDFGSLTISEQGMAHFVGRSGAEVMMAAVVNENAYEIRQKAISRLPVELAHVAQTFPFVPISASRGRFLAVIETHLPPFERATALVEAYLQNISSFFRPVMREQIIEELLPKYYKRREVPRSANVDSEIDAHQLALLLAVFACGAAGDLTMEACNEEGETYKQLARSALGLHSVFEGTSLATVQALALIGSYDLYSASTETIESAFKLLSLAHCLGITIGLHWEPSNWNIEPKYVQRRRNLFWELYGMDVFKSMASGRPVMLRLHEIDCQFPDDNDAKVNEDGSKTQGFWRWQFGYTTSISNDVTEKMCSVRPMKYSDIMELDRKVRAVHRTIDTSMKGETINSTAALQQLIKILHTEAVLLFIHRNFFISALRENVRDPLSTRFASSFLATISSAITMLRFIRRDFAHLNQLLMRHWTMWVITLGAGVVVGTVAATQLYSELTRTALQELQLVIELFEKATAHPVTKNGLPILLRLRDKALENVKTGGLHNTASTPGEVDVKAEVDEALSLIGGTSRVVRNERKIRIPSGDVSSSIPLPAPELRDHRFGRSSEPTDTTSTKKPPFMPPGATHVAQANYFDPPSSSDADLSTYAIGLEGGVAGGIPSVSRKRGHDCVQTLDSPIFHPLLNTSDITANPALPDLGLWLTTPISAPPHEGNIGQFPGNILGGSALTDPSSFNMSIDPSSYDFDIGWLSTGGIPPFTASQEESSQTGDIDAMIEDTWRTIMGDPRLTNTGINESAFQL